MLSPRWASNDSRLCKDFIEPREYPSSITHISRINFLRMPSQLTRLDQIASLLVCWLITCIRFADMLKYRAFVSCCFSPVNELLDLFSFARDLANRQRISSEDILASTRPTLRPHPTSDRKREKTEWHRRGRIASYLWISRLANGFSINDTTHNGRAKFSHGKLARQTRRLFSPLFFPFFLHYVQARRLIEAPYTKWDSTARRYKLLDSKSLSIVKKLLSREKWVARRRFARTRGETWYTRRVLFRSNEDLFATAI